METRKHEMIAIQKREIFLSQTNFKLFLDRSESFNNLEDVYDFFNNVPEFISNFIKAVENFSNKSELSKQPQFEIVVYLMQYCCSYELFKNVYSNHSLEKGTLSEVKRCLSKQLKLLLDNATSVFDSNGNTTVGSFLNLMDGALDKIAEIDIKQGQGSIQLELNVVSSIVEEILCLSMSVAQVAFDDDNKIITASCRSVLNAIENLKTEINQEEPNIAMCNLVVDTCSDTLCAFEAKVNTAVLRLCLKVFCDYKNPLKTLYDFCENSNKPDNDALDPLILAFDLHMDRIFQIGLFSVASSNMGKRVADIKNIMANLEFLEGEIVPAFVAMTKDSLLYRIEFANNILKKSWCTQVKLLRKAVHSVIEPSAYCKLVYEELKQKVEELWQQISDGQNVKRSSIDLFTSCTKELGQMFAECMDSFDSDIKDSITKQLEIVYKVLNELIATRDLLLHENSEESSESNRRIFKRCQVLSLTIKRLWLCTVDGTQEKENQTITNVEGKDNIKNNTITKYNDVTENIKENNPTLDSIVIKSKQILKDRSICHLNQNGITFTRPLKDCTMKKLNAEKSIRLTKNSNIRECSYRQNKKFAENDITIAEHVLPRMKNFKN